MHSQKVCGVHFVAGNWPLDSDKLTLVFIHGSGGSQRLWDAQVGALCQQVNTIAIDLPGHGSSDGQGLDDVGDYTRGVANFIGAIDASGPIPCGLSLGGAIAQQLLIDHPDRFEAGILVGTGARLKVMPSIFETIDSNYDGFLDMLAKFAFSQATMAEVKQPVIDDAARCDPGVTYGDFAACNRFDVMARLNEIRVPVLVVTAEDDKMTPPKYGDFLETGISRAYRAHIKDAGHLMPVEQPQQFNQEIISFLEAIK